MNSRHRVLCVWRWSCNGFLSLAGSRIATKLNVNVTKFHFVFMELMADFIFVTPRNVYVLDRMKSLVISPLNVVKSGFRLALSRKPTGLSAQHCHVSRSIHSSLHFVSIRIIKIMKLFFFRSLRFVPAIRKGYPHFSSSPNVGETLAHILKIV